MAKRIKDTPILFGNDVIRFMERLEEKRTETAEEWENRQADYHLIKSILFECQ